MAVPSRLLPLQITWGASDSTDHRHRRRSTRDLARWTRALILSAAASSPLGKLRLPRGSRAAAVVRASVGHEGAQADRCPELRVSIAARGTAFPDGEHLSLRSLQATGTALLERPSAVQRRLVRRNVAGSVVSSAIGAQSGLDQPKSDTPDVRLCETVADGPPEW